MWCCSTLTSPRVTGIQAAAELRRAQSTLGIVMLTMLAKNEIIEEALAAGADDYLRKDTPFDDLVATVRATVARRSAAQPDDEVTLPRHGADPDRRGTVTPCGRWPDG